MHGAASGIFACSASRLRGVNVVPFGVLPREQLQACSWLHEGILSMYMAERMGVVSLFMACGRGSRFALVLAPGCLYTQGLGGGCWARIGSGHKTTGLSVSASVLGAVGCFILLHLAGCAVATAVFGPGAGQLVHISSSHYVIASFCGFVSTAGAHSNFRQGLLCAQVHTATAYNASCCGLQSIA